ncbi:MAG: ATP-binding protein [Mariprofundales bacterium]
MIDSVFLDNYKQFKEFEINGLKRINILSGENNTGKTSVLEAVFMFYDRRAPDFTLKQFVWRGVNTVELKADSLWQPLFSNFDLSKKITIKVNDNGNEEKAIYQHIENFNTSLAINPNNTPRNQTFSSSNMLTESLKCSYFYKKKNVGESNLFINSDKLSMNTNKLEKAKKDVAFVHSSARGNLSSDSEKLGKIDVENGLKDITEFLKIIEPRLTSLSIIPNGQQSLIYGDIGLKRKIPISYMGEGITKFLSILVTIATTKNGIICLDEIENGIHYSLFPKIWEILDKMTKTYNCQLFITTHSRDVLHGLNEYYKNSEIKDISFIRLDTINDSIIPKMYDSSMLLTAMEREWEIR